MFAARHFRISMLMVLLAMGSLIACQKGSDASASKSSAEIQRSAESAKRALEGLKAPLGEVNGKYAALRQQFDALPPDLPEFGETRGQFYAASIAFGAMTSKVPWLSEKIDVAAKAGDAAALHAISQDIARTHDEIRQADKIALQMLHRVLPFKQLAAELANSNGVACENGAAKKLNQVVPQRPTQAAAKQRTPSP